MIIGLLFGCRRVTVQALHRRGLVMELQIVRPVTDVVLSGSLIGSQT